MKVLGIIPARGGSKGVPRKNIKPLCGKPLLQYTAEAAFAARLLNRIVVSTDDTEIADVARTLGLDVPFLRPAELAADHVPSLPVLQHAVRWLEERGERFDAVCLLQPTHPLRGPEVIDGCIKMLEDQHADAVMTVVAVPPHMNPHWVYFRSPDGILHISTGESTPIPRRQELPPAFSREGSVYIMRRDVLMVQHSLFGSRLIGYPMDPGQTVNIDRMEDWNLAEQRMKERIQEQLKP